MLMFSLTGMAAQHYKNRWINVLTISKQYHESLHISKTAMLHSQTDTWKLCLIQLWYCVGTRTISIPRRPWTDVKKSGPWASVLTKKPILGSLVFCHLCHFGSQSRLGFQCCQRRKSFGLQVGLQIIYLTIFFFLPCFRLNRVTAKSVWMNSYKSIQGQLTSLSCELHGFGFNLENIMCIGILDWINRNTCVNSLRANIAF